MTHGPIFDRDNPVPVHKSDHVSGGGDAFDTTQTVEALVRRILETDASVALKIGALIDGGFLNRIGSEIVATLALHLGSCDFQVFLTDGTWTKPANKTWTRVFCIGAGGGGGSGSPSDADASGGGAGGGGGYSSGLFKTSALGATEAVTVGVGGTGAAAVIGNDTDQYGLDGNDGEASSFGTLVTAGPGYGGKKGVWSLVSATSLGGVGGSGEQAGTAGGASYNDSVPQAGITAAEINRQYSSATGGGGGGGAYSATGRTGGAGGIARISPPRVSTLAGGVGGAGSDAVPATPGSVGNSDGVNNPSGGTGGGGGGGSGNNIGGDGANGGGYGGGGGGGGAGNRKTATSDASGKGGNGADGAVVVVSF